MNEDKALNLSGLRKLISGYKNDITTSVGVGTQAELIEMALTEMSYITKNGWNKNEIADFVSWLNNRKKLMISTDSLSFSNDIEKFQNHLQETFYSKDKMKLSREVKKYRAVLRDRVTLIVNPITKEVCQARYVGFVAYTKQLLAYMKMYSNDLDLNPVQKPIRSIKCNYPRLQHLGLMDQEYKVQKARLIDLCDSRGLSAEVTDELLAGFRTWYSNYRKMTKYRESLE